MFQQKTPYLLISVNGVEAVLHQTEDSGAALVICSRKRISKARSSYYSPLDHPPFCTDQSPYACLYRKLITLTKTQGLRGPFAAGCNSKRYRLIAWLTNRSCEQFIDVLKLQGFAITTKQSMLEDEFEDTEPKNAWWEETQASLKATRRVGYFSKSSLLAMYSIAVIAAAYCLTIGHWKVALTLVLLPLVLPIIPITLNALFFFGWVIWQD